MKKNNPKKKKRTPRKKDSSSSRAKAVKSQDNQAVQVAKAGAAKPLPPAVKKPSAKKEASLTRYFRVAVHFLREARLELKKVKWPTRKELLASTAVVLFLVLVVSFYLGIIDLGLVKGLKLILG
jgi:preprotein translocase subunit SecE